MVNPSGRQEAKPLEACRKPFEWYGSSKALGTMGSGSWVCFVAPGTVQLPLCQHQTVDGHKVMDWPNLQQEKQLQLCVSSWIKHHISWCDSKAGGKSDFSPHWSFEMQSQHRYDRVYGKSREMIWVDGILEQSHFKRTCLLCVKHRYSNL